MKIVIGLDRKIKKTTRYGSSVTELLFCFITKQWQSLGL
jgi:hypothetical protein